MPDGSPHYFKDDAEATEALNAWNKAQQNEEAPLALSPEALKAQQAKIQQSYAETGDPVSFMRGIKLGLQDPIMGGAQLLTRGLAATTGSDYFANEAARVEAINKQITDEAAQEGYSKSGRLIGNVLNPANFAFMGATFAGKPALSAAAQGGIAGAFSPVENAKNYWAEKGQQIGLSGVGGMSMYKIGAAIAPHIRPEAQKLMEQGVIVPPGHTYEGVPGWLFRQMEAVAPGPVNSIITKSFTHSTANDVLAPLGKEVPKGLTGFQMAEFVRKYTSGTYDDAFAKMGKVLPDQALRDSANAALIDAKASMTASGYKQLYNNIQANLVNKFGLGIEGLAPRGTKVGATEGRKLKEAQEYLKEMAAKYKNSTDADGLAYHAAYNEILTGVQQYIYRVDKTGNILKADTVWKNLYRFADAVARADATKGFFSPAQLSAAVKAQSSTLEAGTGRAPMQEKALSGLDVFGDRNDFATKTYRNIIIASKAATGSALIYFQPQYAVPLLTAGGMSYATAWRLMKTPSAARKAVSETVKRMGPAATGAVIGGIMQQQGSEQTTD